MVCHQRKPKTLGGVSLHLLEKNTSYHLIRKIKENELVRENTGQARLETSLGKR